MSNKIDEQELVAKIWMDVIRVVNKLIDAHDKYGFGKFSEGVNPSIEVIVRSFNVVDALLKTLTESGQLDADEYRQVINSRQCILHTKMLALALEAEDEGEYTRLMQLLTTQAPV
jgi:dissimilatory sulfite reductase (desulfoviridin) alpha/beta subunit